MLWVVVDELWKLCCVEMLVEYGLCKFFLGVVVKMVKFAYLGSKKDVCA